MEKKLISAEARALISKKNARKNIGSIDEKIHNSFAVKCKSDGYTMKVVIERLMFLYIKNKIEIE